MPLKPIHAFDDHIRPAKLMLKLYRLLDSDDPILRDGAIVEALRGVASAGAEEELLVVHHLMLTGVVRQRAELRAADLKRATLKNLLRQSVVSACTALDAFLPALLRAHLPLVLTRLGRNFFPASDGDVKEYFQGISFDISEVLALQERTPQEAAETLAAKVLSAANFKYLGSAKGIHVMGCLLQLKQPWDALAAHLSQEKKALRNTVDLTTRRRNDIVHRADRASNDPDNEQQQEIEFSYAQQGVNIIDGVCHALDEVVAKRMKEIEGMPPLGGGGAS